MWPERWKRFKSTFDGLIKNFLLAFIAIPVIFVIIEAIMVSIGYLHYLVFGLGELSTQLQEGWFTTKLAFIGFTDLMVTTLLVFLVIVINDYFFAWCYWVWKGRIKYPYAITSKRGIE